VSVNFWDWLVSCHVIYNNEQSVDRRTSVQLKSQTRLHSWQILHVYAYRYTVIRVANRVPPFSNMFSFFNYVLRQYLLEKIWPLIDTCQNAQNRLCGSTCYSSVSPGAILPWWYTHPHRDSQDEKKKKGNKIHNRLNSLQLLKITHLFISTESWDLLHLLNKWVS